MKPKVEKKKVLPYLSNGLRTGIESAFLLTGLMAGAFQSTLMPILFYFYFIFEGDKSSGWLDSRQGKSRATCASSYGLRGRNTKRESFRLGFEVDLYIVEVVDWLQGERVGDLIRVDMSWGDGRTGGQGDGGTGKGREGEGAEGGGEAV